VTTGRIVLYNLELRKFEEFIAAIFANKGYRVELTEQTRDGGYDIIAVKDTPIAADLRVLVECKRYRPDRPVEVAVVRGLWGLVNDPSLRADRGVIATTSRLSRDAERAIKKSFWKLSALDHDDLMTHLGFELEGALWLPR